MVRNKARYALRLFKGALNEIPEVRIPDFAKLRESNGLAIAKWGRLITIIDTTEKKLYRFLTPEAKILKVCLRPGKTYTTLKMVTEELLFRSCAGIEVKEASTEETIGLFKRLKKERIELSDFY